MKKKRDNDTSIEGNIRLVGYVIKRCFNYRTRTLSNLKLTKDDLYQQGKLGLIEACKNYDEKRGIKFSTYACKFIRGYIYKMIKSNYKNSFAPLMMDIQDYDDAIGRIELIIDFERCCGSCLSEEKINIVYDHIFEGLTFKEIAVKNDMLNEMQAFRIYSESIQKVARMIHRDLYWSHL